MEKGPPGAVVAAASALARFASSETDEDPVCAGSAIDTKVAIADWTRLWRKSHAGKRGGEWGVMEYWSDGVLERRFSPSLQLSITPLLHHSNIALLRSFLAVLELENSLRIRSGAAHFHVLQFPLTVHFRHAPDFQHFARPALAHFDSGVFDEALFRPVQKLQAKVSQPKIRFGEGNHRFVAAERGRIRRRIMGGAWP